MILWIETVGVAGFEPTTYWSQTRRDTPVAHMQFSARQRPRSPQPLSAVRMSHRAR